MRIRAAELQDTAALTYLWKTVFNDEDSFIIKFFRDRFRPYNAVVAEADGKIVSALHIVQCEMLTCGGIYPVSYIVGASTMPGYRGQGIMSKILEYCKNLSCDSCIALFPAVRGFYEKLGFKTVSHVNRYSLNRSYTEKTDAEKPSISELNEVYNTMIMQAGGGVSRDRLAWEFILDEKSTVYVKNKSGGAYANVKDGVAVETAAADAESAELLLNKLSSEGVKFIQAAPGTYIDSLMSKEKHETVGMGMLYPGLDCSVYISEQY